MQGQVLPLNGSISEGSSVDSESCNAVAPTLSAAMSTEMPPPPSTLPAVVPIVPNKGSAFLLYYPSPQMAWASHLKDFGLFINMFCLVQWNIIRSSVYLCLFRLKILFSAYFLHSFSKEIRFEASRGPEISPYKVRYQASIDFGTHPWKRFWLTKIPFSLSKHFKFAFF